VVNASRDKAPVAGCKVVLSARLQDKYVVIAEASSDQWGQFQFDGLDVGPYFEYLPGANYHDVHYPGPAVHLTTAEPRAAVELSVCDSVAAPSPLVLQRQEISLRSEEGVLYVTESLAVDNPSSTCYVGQARREGEAPITLRLNIPPEFERATFDEEYFGRHFSVSDGALVTSLPWPPGKKEVKFTYAIRNAEFSRQWQRPLDLPCADLCIRVRTANPDEVTCDLAPGVVARENQKPGQTEAVFHSSATLPAGSMIRVGLKKLPVPWMVQARWIALTALLIAIGGICILTVRRRKGRRRLAPK
jgi:hypothetical protein